MEFKYLFENRDGNLKSCKILDTPVKNVENELLKTILFNIELEDGSIEATGRWNITPKPVTENPTHRFLHGSMCGSFYEDCNILEKLTTGKVRVVFFDSFINEWSYQDVDLEDLIELKVLSNNDVMYKQIV